MESINALNVTQHCIESLTITLACVNANQGIIKVQKLAWCAILFVTFARASRHASVAISTLSNNQTDHALVSTGIFFQALIIRQIRQISRKEMNLMPSANPAHSSCPDAWNAQAKQAVKSGRAKFLGF